MQKTRASYCRRFANGPTWNVPLFIRRKGSSSRATRTPLSLDDFCPQIQKDPIPPLWATTLRRGTRSSSTKNRLERYLPSPASKNGETGRRDFFALRACSLHCALVWQSWWVQDFRRSFPIRCFG